MARSLIFFFEEFTPPLVTDFTVDDLQDEGETK